jgi:hypothetical protein
MAANALELIRQGARSSSPPTHETRSDLNNIVDKLPSRTELLRALYVNKSPRVVAVRMGLPVQLVKRLVQVYELSEALAEAEGGEETGTGKSEKT